jgi:hypothetical protein
VAEEGLLVPHLLLYSTHLVPHLLLYCTHLVPHAVVCDEDPAPREEGPVEVAEEGLLVQDVEDGVSAASIIGQLSALSTLQVKGR